MRPWSSMIAFIGHDVLTLQSISTLWREHCDTPVGADGVFGWPREYLALWQCDENASFSVESARFLPDYNLSKLFRIERRNGFYMLDRFFNICFTPTTRHLAIFVTGNMSKSAKLHLGLSGHSGEKQRYLANRHPNKLYSCVQSSVS